MRTAPYLRELRSLWHLAWPLALVQLNNNLTGAVDTALAGRVNDVALAGTGVASSVFGFLVVMGMAAGFGTEPLVAQAFGAGNRTAARHVLWQGIYVGLWTSVPIMAVGVLITCNLETMGVTPDVAAAARAVLIGRCPSLPFYCVFMALRAYLQAARLTRPVLLSAIVMNVFNLVADWLLLFGDAGLVRLGLPAIGLPALGVFGLGLASALAAVLQWAIVARAAWVLRDEAATVAAVPQRAEVAGLTLEVLNVRGLPPANGPTMRRIAGLGLPAGAQFLAEVGVFALVGVLMGGMGAAIAAAHQTALALASLSFSVCIGIGAATTVHVGRAIGRGDVVGTRHSGVAGLALGLGYMLLSSALMTLVPESLAALMTNDPHVIPVAARLLRIAGVFQLADGAQAVAAGALRGAGSSRWAFVANLVAHWGIGLPLAWVLAYRFGLGPVGLWWGLTVGLILVALALCVRFWRLTAHPIAALQV